MLPEFSVADSGCLSRILIFTHPGSRIPDPKTVVTPVFSSHKFHKIENYFIFEMKKKIWANFQRIIELFTQKIWVWDTGSGKNLFRIRIQESKRHRIPDPDPQYCLNP
jgi:hypothetical protein